MNKDSINEMEQIQRGLERFLEQEIEGYKKENSTEDHGHEAFRKDYRKDRGQKSIVGHGTACEDECGENNVNGQQENVNGQEMEYENGYDDIDEDDCEEEYFGEEDKNDSQEYDSEEYESLGAPHKKQGRPRAGGANGGRGKPVKRKSIPAFPAETARASDKTAGSAPGISSGPKMKKKKSKKAEKSDNLQEETVTASKGKKKKKKSGLKRFSIILIILDLALAGLWYYMVGNFYGKMNYEEIESVTEAPMKEKGVTNILLIGNDSRTKGEDGRSDAMILLSISNETKTIYMTSLLRDMYVEIPGHKGNRLNAAYAYGGAELLMETLEQNLDISVNRYVLVNFQAFANLVDAVGGVDLELTNEEVIYINGYLVEYNILEGRPEGTDYLDASLSGLIHLNGPQALAYCRNRYLGTDFGRTERQRKVLSAVIKQTPLSLITNPKGLVDGFLPNLTTNLTQGECLDLSLQAAKVVTYDIVQSSIPIEGSYSGTKIRGMDVLEVDFEKNKEYIRTNIYGRESDAELFSGKQK